MSFEIELGDVHIPGKAGSRLGVETLPSDGREHTHGRLEIKINGRALPYLGYFGPDDVCIGQWAHELLLVLRKLSGGIETRHLDGCQSRPETGRLQAEAEEGSDLWVVRLLLRERGYAEGVAVLCGLLDVDILHEHAGPDSGGQ